MHVIFKHLHYLRSDKWGKSRARLWQSNRTWGFRDVISDDSLGQIWFVTVCFWTYWGQDASRSQKNSGSSSDSSWSRHSLSVVHIHWVPAMGFLSSGRRPWQGEGLGGWEEQFTVFTTFLVSLQKGFHGFELWKCMPDLLHCRFWESRLWLQVSRR